MYAYILFSDALYDSSAAIAALYLASMASQSVSKNDLPPCRVCAARAPAALVVF
jgi:hypothetical protein